MLASERFIFILDQLDREGVVTLKTVCEQLNASESTIRRDFEELEKQNKLKRVHGGAVKVSLGTTLTDSKEMSMQQKSQINIEGKQKICRYCAQMVQDGECIFIDGGTTLMYLIDYLEGKRVKIVTNNHFVVTKQGSTIELINIGGHYLPNLHMTVGSIALQTLEMFNFDYAFIGCAGIDISENIAYTAEMDSAQIKKAAMNQALKSYLLVDSTKMDLRGFYKFSDIKRFDSVIMDDYDSNRKKPTYITVVE
ncbi:DeoR family fructose operon transcriptional repressor [Breznakia sp. PF5-3]|uniref:DeoR/GlpR family DNA-binding transcription regulator n=1 Tax=unclassified Breznakia TaxID=2623764 RepID=UPI0024077166|nr:MULTISPECIES: DeoR/GlpR family DNA-binding transcription regulator [unclassified Breznakia]MDF9823829.1 DeoR family fructose operon transcriptional repressor [Breznakia sp. PM6-1]MDF9834605.1 DeoR family fructose operon transcriptional repressor [Breznakia sp. PF5-3]MDF9836778.1 DeoR family fructose operon transcriptional repressor [Breznakia sp. PFB2-8]MDF9858773.1 DeoR family fructose operon transcriptional repressor [Breznakia sp. PH5-24]